MMEKVTIFRGLIGILLLHGSNRTSYGKINFVSEANNYENVLAKITLKKFFN